MPENLTTEVKALRESIEMQQSRITRQNLIIAIGCLVLALVIGGGVWLWRLNENLEDANKELASSQVINCQNANNTRANQRILWDFVLDVSNDAGPEEAAILESIRTFIHDLFAERDCSDLTKEYRTPVPPDIEKLLKGS